MESYLLHCNNSIYFMVYPSICSPFIHLVVRVWPLRHDVHSGVPPGGAAARSAGGGRQPGRLCGGAGRAQLQPFGGLFRGLLPLFLRRPVHLWPGIVRGQAGFSTIKPFFLECVFIYAPPSDVFTYMLYAYAFSAFPSN